MAQRKKKEKHQNSVRLLGRGDRLFKIWKTSPHLFASPHTLPKAGLILHIVLYKSIHPLEAPILPQQVPRPFKCVVLDIQAMGGWGRGGAAPFCRYSVGIRGTVDQKLLQAAACWYSHILRRVGHCNFHWSCLLTKPV